MNTPIEIIWGEYIRLLAYAIVILSIPFELRMKRNYNKFLFIGDLVFGILSLISIVYAQVTQAPQTARLIFITPAAIIWAVVHVINLSNSK